MTSAREVIARALLIHDEPKARLEDQSAAEQERYRTEAKWFERYLEAEGLTVQTADEVDARIAEAVARERERMFAALCPHCAAGDVPEKVGEPLGICHVGESKTSGFPTYTSCRAAAIRET